jgi:hypothetical protein
MDEMSSAVRCLFALGVLAFGAAACSALISLDGYSSGAGAGAADGAAEASSDAVGIPDDGGTADAALDAPPLSYVAEVLADLPAAYWRFGEDGGTTATDQRGTHPGSYVGDVQLGVAGAIRGDSDTAIALDGGSVAFGDVFGFEGRAAFTVEAWAKPAVVDLSYRNIYSKITDGEPRSGHFMWVHATDGVAFERNLDFVDAPPAGVQDGVGGHTPLQVGAWSQMVATYLHQRAALRSGLVDHQPACDGHAVRRRQRPVCRRLLPRRDRRGRRLHTRAPGGPDRGALPRGRLLSAPRAHALTAHAHGFWCSSMTVRSGSRTKMACAPFGKRTGPSVIG